MMILMLSMIMMLMMTAIIWNTEKYHGSPLELDDSRLGKLATWVKSHNLTVVKLDCTTR